MNLILDIDGTLIDRDEDGPIIRPHLGIFLAYAFEKFDRVSIWTNAAPAWYKRVKLEIFDDVMPEGKNFDFVWTRENCFLETTKMGPDGRFYFPITRKPLSLVYAAFPLAYNSSNTYVIDDTCETYTHNLSNAVPIETYNWGELSTTGNCSMDGEDSELLRLITYFEKHLFAATTKEEGAIVSTSQISIHIPSCLSPDRSLEQYPLEQCPLLVEQYPLGQGQLLGQAPCTTQHTTQHTTPHNTPQPSPISRADTPVLARAREEEYSELAELKSEHRARAISGTTTVGYETTTTTTPTTTPTTPTTPTPTTPTSPTATTTLVTAFSSQLNIYYPAADNAAATTTTTTAATSTTTAATAATSTTTAATTAATAVTTATTTTTTAADTCKFTAIVLTEMDSDPKGVIPEYEKCTTTTSHTTSSSSPSTPTTSSMTSSNTTPTTSTTTYELAPVREVEGAVFLSRLNR
jgi:hypothetical protein